MTIQPKVQFAHYLNLLSLWLSCMFTLHMNRKRDLSLMAQSVLPSRSQPKPVQVLSHTSQHNCYGCNVVQIQSPDGDSNQTSGCEMIKTADKQ